MKSNPRSLQWLLAVMFCIAPLTAAQAYVGPGAGLSLLGALWGLVAALGAAVLFVVLWPIRRARRQRKLAAEANQASKAEENVTTPVDVEGPTVDSTDDVKVPDVLSVPAGEVVADAYEDLDGEGDEYEDEDE